MDEKNNIRVVVVEPFTILRSGLHAILRDTKNIELVGVVSSGIEALALCTRSKSDVVIVSLHLRDMEVTELIRLLLDKAPSTAILIIANDIEEWLVREILTAGAMGFLFMDATISDLVSAINTVHYGNPALSPQAAQILLQAAARSHQSQVIPLTKRELEILGLMMQGLNNSDIAVHLLISPFTVKNHVSNILSKLGASTRTEAVSIAFKANLLNSENSRDRVTSDMRWPSRNTLSQQTVGYS